MNKLLYGFITIYSAVVVYKIVKDLKNHYCSKINSKIVLKDDTIYNKKKVSQALIRRLEVFEN
ncbi:MAG: hypothetical protein ACOCV1_04120 [Bacillota bacterium]